MEHSLVFPGVLCLLVFLALIVTILSTLQPQPKAPLWVAVLLLCIVALLQLWRP